MNVDHFDALARALTTSTSRRAAAGAVVGTLLGIAPLGRSPAGFAATRVGKRKTARQGPDRRKNDRSQQRHKAPTSDLTDEPTRAPAAETVLPKISERDGAARRASGEVSNDKVSVAACLPPGAKKCRKPTDCCSGRCNKKKKKCLPCASGTEYCAGQETCIPTGTVCCPKQNSDICDGQCVDLQSDPSHCGHCSTACSGGTTCADGACVAARYRLVTSWGSEGSGDGQFGFPRNVALDQSGNVYVADTDNNRIDKFTGDGQFLTAWTNDFREPNDVAVDENGNIYVADTDHDRIVKLASDGTLINTWGSFGFDDGQFSTPTGVAVAPGGNIYVGDYSNERIQWFTSDGGFLGKFGRGGNGPGEFNGPAGLAVAPDGDVYVADVDNNRVQRFTASGDFVSAWGVPGSGGGQFDAPVDAAVDDDGNVYVADQYNRRIQKFTPRGTYVTEWSADGGNYVSVVVDPSGNVYVANTVRKQIRIFEPY